MSENLHKLTDSELRKLAFTKLSKTKQVDFNSATDDDLKRMAYEKMLNTTAEQKESSTGQAILEGAGQGLTAGYLPQLQAKLEPVTDRIFNLFSDEKVDAAPWSQTFSNDENYIKSRDSNIKRNKQLAEDNPVSYYGSMGAGSIITGAAASPAQAASLGARALQAGAVGGAYGGLANPGDIEGVVDEIQLAPRLRNAVIGTLTGYGAQKGLDKIAQASKPLAKKIATIAERRAAKALGLQKHLRKNLTQGQIDDAGRFALDNDILETSIFNNTGKMIKRNEAALKNAGSKMDDVYSMIDDANVKEFSPLETAAKVDDELGGFWRDPINKAETKQFDNTLETILNRGDDNIPLKEAQQLKEKLAKAANWKNTTNVTDKERMAREAVKIVTQSIDEAAEKGASKIGAKGVVEQLQKARKDYASGKTVEKLLKNRVDKEQGNNFVSLTDFLVGTTGASSLGPAGIGLVGVKKIADKYGSQVTARYLDKFAKVINKTPGLSELSSNNQAAFQALLYKLAVKSEKNLGNRAIHILNTAEDDQIKGQDKWIGRGLSNVIKNNPNINMEDQNTVKKLLHTKKGEVLLKQASGAKLNSKSMMDINKKIEQLINKDEK